MNVRSPVAFVLLLVSALAGAQCASGQVAGRTVGAAIRPGQVLGQVRGRVFDEHGASIPDASVIFAPLDSRSGLTEFGSDTDARGRFDFEGVRTGTYRVTCRALGYETSVVVQEVRPGVQTEVTLIMRAVKP